MKRWLQRIIILTMILFIYFAIPFQVTHASNVIQSNVKPISLLQLLNGIEWKNVYYEWMEKITIDDGTYTITGDQKQALQLTRTLTTKESETPTLTPVEPPVSETPIPVESPVVEIPTPIESPVTEAPTPVEAPVTEAPQPVEPPVIEAPTTEPVEPPVVEVTIADGTYEVPFQMLQNQSDQPSTLVKYVKAPIQAIVKDGQSYLQFTLNTSDMIAKIILHPEGGLPSVEAYDIARDEEKNERIVQFPITSINNPFMVGVTVDTKSQYGLMEHKVRVIPGQAVRTGEAPATIPSEYKVTEEVTEKELGSYPFVVWKKNEDILSVADNYFEKPATVIERDGQKYVRFYIKNENWWQYFKVAHNGTYAEVTTLKTEERTEANGSTSNARLVEFPFNTFDEVIDAKVHIIVTGIPGLNYDNEYEIRLVIQNNERVTVVADPAEQQVEEALTSLENKQAVTELEKEDIQTLIHRVANPKARQLFQNRLNAISVTEVTPEVAPQMVDLPFIVLKEGTNERSVADDYFEKPMKTYVKDGKYYIQATLKNSDWWQYFRLESEGSYKDFKEIQKFDDQRKLVEFQVDRIDGIVQGKMHIIVTGIPGFHYDNKYTVRLLLGSDQIPTTPSTSPVEQPVKETPTPAPTVEQPVKETPTPAPTVEQPVKETPTPTPSVEQPVKETLPTKETTKYNLIELQAEALVTALEQRKTVTPSAKANVQHFINQVSNPEVRQKLQQRLNVIQITKAPTGKHKKGHPTRKVLIKGSAIELQAEVLVTALEQRKTVTPLAKANVQHFVNQVSDPEVRQKLQQRLDAILTTTSPEKKVVKKKSKHPSKLEKPFIQSEPVSTKEGAVAATSVKPKKPGTITVEEKEKIETHLHTVQEITKTETVETHPNNHPAPTPTPTAPAPSTSPVEATWQEVNYVVWKSAEDVKSVADDYFVKPAQYMKRDGKHIVRITIKNEDWWKYFKVETNGAFPDVTTISTDPTAKTRLVEFEVDDMTKIINSKVHIIVTGIPGFVYDNEYDIRLKFEELKPATSNPNGGSVTTPTVAPTSTPTIPSTTSAPTTSPVATSPLTSSVPAPAAASTDHPTYDRTQDDVVKETAPSIVKPATSGPSLNPKTGDHSQLVWFALLCILSCSLLIGRGYQHVRANNHM